jgi:hypothetical protein
METTITTNRETLQQKFGRSVEWIAAGPRQHSHFWFRVTSRCMTRFILSLLDMYCLEMASPLWRREGSVFQWRRYVCCPATVNYIQIWFLWKWYIDTLSLELQEVLGRINRLFSLIRQGGHIENDASNYSSIVACVFVTALMYLPCRCLATIRGFLLSRCLATIRGILSPLKQHNGRRRTITTKTGFWGWLHVHVRTFMKHVSCLLGHSGWIASGLSSVWAVLADDKRTKWERLAEQRRELSSRQEQPTAQHSVSLCPFQLLFFFLLFNFRQWWLLQRLNSWNIADMRACAPRPCCSVHHGRTLVTGLCSRPLKVSPTYIPEQG